MQRRIIENPQSEKQQPGIDVITLSKSEASDVARYRTFQLIKSIVDSNNDFFWKTKTGNRGLPEGVTKIQEIFKNHSADDLGGAQQKIKEEITECCEAKITTSPWDLRFWKNIFYLDNATSRFYVAVINNNFEELEKLDKEIKALRQNPAASPRK